MKILHSLIIINLFVCAAANGTGSLERAENKFLQLQSKKLCAYMNSETMFPNPEIYSLAIAAEKGNIESIENIIKSGIKPNSTGLHNCTVLFWSMKNIVGYKKLLTAGADPNFIFDDGGSVMRWAIRHKNPEFLMLALKYGGNPNLKTGHFQQTLLFEAVAPENKNKIDMLISSGADINATDMHGTTPAMTAAGLGQYDVVLKLLIAGADYNHKNTRGKTLSDIIRKRSKTMDPKSELTTWMHKVVKWLKEKGVAVDIQAP